MKVRVQRRPAIIVTSAVILAGGTAALIAKTTTAPGYAAPAAGPIEGRVHIIGLRTTGKTAVVPARATPPFSLIGVDWPAPHEHLNGTTQVRIRSATTGAWSAWRSLSAKDDDAPDGTGHERSRRGATAPLWTGAANGVDVRVAGRRALPAGLRVVLIDPGARRRRPVRAAGQQPVRVGLAADSSTDPSTAPSDSTSTTPTTAPSPSSPDSPGTTPTAGTTDSPTASPSGSPATSTAPRPTIVSRAEWGADESLVTSPPSYGKSAKVVFVHHTDTGNDYSCADSAAVVRSILLYHVKTNGWNDLGYNFLVDKCGTLFEGRAGGVDRPVIGAHAYGFNTNSAGVAVLGTFTDVTPPQAALDTVAKVAAWKLGINGGDPTGSTTLVEGVNDGNFPPDSSVTFKTISGHHDANSTACPGLIYDKLGTIRTAAAQWTKPADMTGTSLTGATNAGGTYYTKGAVTLHWQPAAASGYDLLDNGTVIGHAPGSAVSAATTLPDGSHRLRVRATNMNGGTTESPEYPVIADTTKPVFSTPPALTVRTGTASTTKMPVQLGWKVTDNRLLQTIRSTSPSAATFATTTTHWSSYAKPSTSTPWSLTATDAAGNTATGSVTRTTSYTSEFSATRTGTWKTTVNSHYLGGKGLYSSAKGATASWTFTGRSVGLITRRGTTLGKLYIYIDGTYVTTLDTEASSSLYRQVQWTRNWSGSGHHTIKIKVAGTSGRPTIALDGITYVG